MQPANYVLFREVVGLLFLLDLLYFSTRFFRYFGTPFFPNSILRTRWHAAIAAIVWGIAAIGLMAGQFPLLCAATLLGARKCERQRVADR